MPHGTSKGKIDDVFKKRIEALEEAARSAADSFKKNYSDDNYRKWSTPKEVKDLMHVPSLHMPAWDRYKINELYSAEILNGSPENGGTCADLVAMKAQNDFLAAEERAFRLRHASYARCAALMHGRLDGQGLKDKSTFSFVKTSIEHIIRQGQKSTAQPTFTGDVNPGGGIGIG